PRRRPRSAGSRSWPTPIASVGVRARRRCTTTRGRRAQAAARALHAARPRVARVAEPPPLERTGVDPLAGMRLDEVRRWMDDYKLRRQVGVFAAWGVTAAH